ncbi:MAG: AzlC family ABC transporter permease [Eubacterium sp.]|nr:AzlC family ABC transporter permease [Eubacterium sp.]
MENKAPSLIKTIWIRTTPVMAGFLFLGIAYGISMKAMGLSTLTVAACSIFIYAGSLQFALISILTGPFAPLTTLFMTLFVNARHIFYGLAMLKEYGKLPHPLKEYCIFALTDETFSLVVHDPPEKADKKKWYAGISLLDHLYWICGSLAGALLGQVLPFDLTGIDFAMTALFAVIVTEQTRDAFEQWKSGQIRKSDFLFPTILGFAATILSLIVFGSGCFLLVAMGLMMTGFYISYSRDRRNAA